MSRTAGGREDTVTSQLSDFQARVHLHIREAGRCGVEGWAGGMWLEGGALGVSKEMCSSASRRTRSELMVVMMCAWKLARPRAEGSILPAAQGGQGVLGEFWRLGSFVLEGSSPSRCMKGQDREKVLPPLPKPMATFPAPP